MKPNHTLLRRMGTPFSIETTGLSQATLRKRAGVLLAILAVPAMAAPGDFGAVAGAAPAESASVAREIAKMRAMPFERPGSSFPGSAFFYLADPSEDVLVALPATNPFGSTSDNGVKVGELIDAGPPAQPFRASFGGASYGRAVQCLAQAIWYEAASETESGQRAVAQVVLNRVAHPSWPDSVCGVVYQGSQRSTGCQFTFTCDGSLARRASGETWRRARAIASSALSGSVYAPVGHATHYHTLWVNPRWASSLDRIGMIGAHQFYRNRGLGGERAAFSSRYAGFEPGVSGRTDPARIADISIAAPRIEYSVPPASTKPAAPVARATGADGTGATSSAANAPYQAAGKVKDVYANAGQWKPRIGTQGTSPSSTKADSPSTE